MQRLIWGDGVKPKEREESETTDPNMMGLSYRGREGTTREGEEEMLAL